MHRDYEKYDEEGNGDTSAKELWIYTLILLYLLFGARPTINFFDRLGNSDDIRKLNSGEVFHCTNGGGIYSSGIKYIVSKKRGWSGYKGEYFTKGDLIIKIIKCKTE